MADERIVAVGLLTATNLEMLRGCLKKVYKIDETPCFPDLLRAIDEADREHWREQDRLEALKRLRREAAAPAPVLSQNVSGAGV
jgi:hypothetical protein